MSIFSRHRIFSMVLAAAALVFAGTATGCASFWTPITSTTTTNNNVGDIVYVGKNSSSTLFGYQVGTGGSLTAVTSGLTVAYAPTSLVISPNNQFLYVGTTNGIYAYSIGSGGALSALNGGDALAQFSVAAMDISPDGNWLVAIATSPLLNSGGGNLYPLSSTTGLISATGAATLPAPLSGTGQAVQFAPTENGTNVTTSTIAASFGTAGVYTYTFLTTTSGLGGYEAQPSAIPVNSAVVGASDNGLVWNSAGTAIFFVGGGGDNTLYSYFVDTGTGYVNGNSGVITSLPSGAVTTGANPVAVAFNATGNNSTGSYLYVTNAGTSGSLGTTISGYNVSVGATSTTLTPLSSSPYLVSGSSPGALLASGSYMFALTQLGPPDVMLYTVDTNTPGRLYVTSSEDTGAGIASGSAPGTGLSIAATTN